MRYYTDSTVIYLNQDFSIGFFGTLKSDVVPEVGLEVFLGDDGTLAWRWRPRALAGVEVIREKESLDEVEQFPKNIVESLILGTLGPDFR